MTRSFWQQACELAALDEQHRLEAIEQGWSSSCLAALRQHLHLKPAELEPLLAIAEATKARRVREQVISRRSSRALRFEPVAHSGMAAQ